MGSGQPTIDCAVESFVALQQELIGASAPGSSPEVVVERPADDWFVFRSLATGVTLRFDVDEVDAFVEGIRVGEFLPALTTS